MERSPLEDKPVEQHRPLGGEGDEIVFEDKGIPVAGRSYRARHPKGMQGGGYSKGESV